MNQFLQQSPKNTIIMNDYIFLQLASWYEKTGQTMYMRQSSMPTVKFVRGFDYFWLLSKQYPFAERIDMAIKVIHQMGVLGRFKIPIRHNPNLNPYQMSRKEDAEKVITLNTLSGIFNFLLISLLSVAIYFIREYFGIMSRIYLPTCLCSYGKVKKKVYIFIIALVCSLLIIYLKQREVEDKPTLAFALLEPFSVNGPMSLTVYSERHECQAMILDSVQSMDPSLRQARLSLSIIDDLIAIVDAFMTLQIFQAGNAEKYYQQFLVDLGDMHFIYYSNVVHLPKYNTIWLQGGLNEHPNGPDKKSSTPKTALFNLTHYKAKVGPSLPLPMFLHCSVAIDEDTVFIFGGKPDKRNASGVYNTTFVFSFTNESWTEVHAPNPCSPMNSWHKLSCELYETFVVIPSSTIGGDQPCTALFDINSNKYSKLHNDQRLYPSGGKLIVEQGTLYHLGGIDDRGRGTNLIYSLNKSS